MVPAHGDMTHVRIHNVNTGKRIEAVIATPDREVTYDGDASIVAFNDLSRQHQSPFETCGMLMPNSASCPRIMFTS